MGGWMDGWMDEQASFIQLWPPTPPLKQNAIGMGVWGGMPLSPAWRPRAMEGERRQVPRKSEGGGRRGSGSQITYFFLAHISHSCLAKNSLTPPPSSHLFTLTTRCQLHPQPQPQSTDLQSAAPALYCLTMAPRCLQSKTQAPGSSLVV